MIKKESTKEIKSLDNHTSTLTVFIFATINRSDIKSKPVMKRITANSYKEARSELVKNHVISFAGRIPVQEVCNA
ncbi:TPA: host cell division inhibitor Icd-like protein [Yersinia enterocolitica]|nr:host cell division inhibitor Icd-like protein [Yersinia enterocolitica]